ncbi:hypothetical protein [Massilia sp. CCM 8734]|uniref:hypothetical protein n=1 Tax=Massilia sp. CCM 8734 TaxID=2609283 RepID=UPI0014203B9D|nr:hypothetical protein [Massilia sp. CCM 8734]NHZ99626.1 hypothetical protein [Massilia sp. CCM 8734]
MTAVNVGIANFVAEPLNDLSPNGAMNGDFNDSRGELKAILAKKNISPALDSVGKPNDFD